MDNDNEIVLEKYNKKSWLKSLLLGLIMGIAVIVPGISGSTVAIMFKLYDKFLHAIGNLFKKFVTCFLFLLPIGLGILIGFSLGFIAIRDLIDKFIFILVCLFAGLMIGAFPAVKDEIKNEKTSTLRIILLIIGILIPIGIGVYSVCLEKATMLTSYRQDKLANLDFLKIMAFVPIGYVVAVTQVVPGLSATALLMSIGYFGPLMDSFHREYWASNPAVFGVYGALIVGFLIGLLTFSKLLTIIFKKARAISYYLIVGLSLGSIISMFINSDIYVAYQGWANGNGLLARDLLIGLPLLVVGFMISYALLRYERKKSLEENNVKESN